MRLDDIILHRMTNANNAEYVRLSPWTITNNRIIVEGAVMP